jgi:N utilization substance protein B
MNADPHQAGRSRASRLAAVQALYQIDMGAAGVDAAIDCAAGEGSGTLIEEERHLAADPFVLGDIVRGTIERRNEVDEMIAGSLDQRWKLDRLELLLRAILRAAVYELLARRQVPARVVINEYVDLAHAFYDRGEAGLVNAVLDRLAHVLRADEFLAAGSSGR